MPLYCLIWMTQLYPFLQLVDSADSSQLSILYALWSSMSLKFQVKDSLPGPRQTRNIPQPFGQEEGSDKITHLLSGKGFLFIYLNIVALSTDPLDHIPYSLKNLALGLLEVFPTPFLSYIFFGDFSIH